MDNLIYGIGNKGSGFYNSNSLAYKRWRNMLKRVTDTEYQKLHPDYSDCIVCDEWLNLDNFGKWFDKNYIEGYELDKDLIEFGNKIYSPDKCIFIPKNINKLFHVQNKTSDLPHGVVYNRNKFRSSIPNKTFDRLIDAKNCFWNNKYNLILSICDNYPEFKDMIMSYFELYFVENYE
jgi:hypothetical protein